MQYLNNLSACRYSKILSYNIHLLIILFLCTELYAETAIISKEETQQPVHITSNEMVSEDNGHKITFTGDVVTKREKMVIYSNKLEVYNSNNNESIVKIVATGNVRIDKDGRHAEGERAIYFEQDKRIELSGNVRAWENENEITGEKMVLFIDEDRIIVTGNRDKRVNVTFYTREDEKK